MHRGSFPIHGRVGADSLDHETQRRLSMAVTGGDFSWQDELEPRVERVRDRRAPSQPRIFQHQHASLGLLGADDVPRFEEVGADGVVAPEGRYARRARAPRHELAQYLPQRGQVFPADAVVKGLALWRGLWRRENHGSSASSFQSDARSYPATRL